MTGANYVPKRGTLVNAVEAALERFVDKSEAYVKLRSIPRTVFRVGDPMIVTFQQGATENCYGAELVFCEETDERATRIWNYAVTRENLTAWADELWKNFEEDE